MSEIAWGYERHEAVQVLQAGVRKTAVVNGHLVAVEVNQSSAAVARRRSLVVRLHGARCIAQPEVPLGQSYETRPRGDQLRRDVDPSPLKPRVPASPLPLHRPRLGPAHARRRRRPRRRPGPLHRRPRPHQNHRVATVPRSNGGTHA